MGAGWDKTIEVLLFATWFKGIFCWAIKPIVSDISDDDGDI